MADSPPDPVRGDDARGGRARKSTPGTPRWVKVFVAVALVVVVVVAVMLLIGGGEHGPGRHLGGHSVSGELAGYRPPG